MTQSDLDSANLMSVETDDNESFAFTSVDQSQPLRDNIAMALDKYFSELDGQLPTNVYDMVLSQVEEPLMNAVMRYTRNNQSKASIVLGLNRGTLRKKLKQYDLL